MKTLTYNNSSELIADLNRYDENWIYRGHSNAKWNIESLAARDAKRLSLDVEAFESKAITSFKRRAKGLIPKSEYPKGMLEWLSLLQHHGGPSRLLDFTYSFWVALFFATEFSCGDCALFLLNTKPLMKKNISVNHDKLLSCLLRLDKDHFIVKKDFTSIQYCLPNNLNQRISIQNGVFVYQTNIKDTFIKSCNSPISEVELKKLVIKKSIINEIKSRLSKTICISSTLFPGIDGFARSMRNYHL